MLTYRSWWMAWKGEVPGACNERDPKDPRQPLQLCFACLEKRLGRPLYQQDFNRGIVNEDHIQKFKWATPVEWDLVDHRAIEIAELQEAEAVRC